MKISDLETAVAGNFLNLGELDATVHRDVWPKNQYFCDILTIWLHGVE